VKPRALAVLFVVVAALGAFVWFVDRDLPSSDERVEQAKKVFDLKEDAVSLVAWERDGERVELRRSAEGEKGDWQLKAPLEGRADGPAVDALVTALLALEKERTMDDGDAAQMQLAPPRATVEIGSDDDRRPLLIGGEVPASSDMIVAPSADGPFYVVARSVWDPLQKPGGEWRSHDVYSGSREAIDRLVLRGPSGEVKLARRGEDFWVEAPLTDVADAGTVNRLLDALTGLKIDRFVDQKEAGEDPYGLATASSIEVGSGADTWNLELGGSAATVAADGAREDDAKETGSGDRYARAEGRMFTVSSALDEALARPAEEWRSLEWARRQVFEIDAIDVSDATGDLELRRDGGEWKVSDADVDFNRINDLLYAVTGIKAEALDASPAGEPMLSITLDPGDAEVRLEVFTAVADRYPATASDRPTALWLGGDRVRDVEAKLAALRDAVATAAAAAEAPAAGADDAADTPPDAAADTPPGV
jgi:Domain of unknown function (DUF4340)